MSGIDHAKFMVYFFTNLTIAFFIVSFIPIIITFGRLVFYLSDKNSSYNIKYDPISVKIAKKNIPILLSILILIFIFLGLLFSITIYYAGYLVSSGMSIKDVNLLVKGN